MNEFVRGNFGFNSTTTKESMIITMSTLSNINLITDYSKKIMIVNSTKLVCLLLYKESIHFVSLRQILVVFYLEFLLSV